MEIYCTRPSCSRPSNIFADLDDSTKIKTTSQKYCTTCGMPLILDHRYLPVKLLGKGGFGAAFLARDRRTPGMRYCVVKQFQPSGNLTAHQLQVAQTLFEREAEVLEDLGNRHQQIPDLFAFFPLDVPNGNQSEQFFYIVQEFVDGEDMETALARRGKFSEAEAVEILTELLKILQFVHDNQSIHRDIKPSNIMRRRDGRLFLLDFGAVKQVTAGAAAGQPGKASTGIYSMGFAPPEQMRGDKVYPATDLYALAVTCITLLTGKQPNELHDTYSDTWNWRPYAQVSDRLEAIFNRMLLPIPSQRFQSAQEVLIALQPIQPVQPLQPIPPPPPPPIPLPPPASASSAPQTAIQPPASATAPPTALPAPATSPPPPPPPPQPAASPAVVPAVPVAVAPVARSRSAFTLIEVLSSAAFTGFEGGLLAIAVASLLGTASFSAFFWVILLLLLGGLAFAQNRRWIEKVDFLIIAGITLLAVWLVPAALLHKIIFWSPLSALGSRIGLEHSLTVILLIAGFSGLIAIAATAVFRLVYMLLTRWL